MLHLPAFLTDPDPNIYLGGNYVVLDFETTVVDKGSALSPENSIVLSVWRLGPRHPARQQAPDGGAVSAHRVCWGGEFELQELVRDIECADFLIAHNAKFELQWLERCGLDLTDVLVWDTMIGEYVIGGNRWVGHAVSLQNCAKRRSLGGKTDIITKMYKSGLCSTDIPSSWLEAYCKRDADLTLSLFLKQREEMVTLDLLPVMYTRCLATPVLADIEKNGMQLDPDLVLEKLDRVERDFAAEEQKLDILTNGINLNSPKQLSAFLYDDLGFEERRVKKQGKWQPDRTPSGGRKTDQDTIQSLTASTQEQEEFLESYVRYKALYNEATKYLRKFADCVRDDGGLLHASFNQTNTQTHRLSSTGSKYSTQFQNFPRSYKPMFMARKSRWLVGECDGAQLEFRVAAHLGRDDVALRDIEDGTDVHSVTAGIIGTTRNGAKAHTFKPLYGGKSGTDKEREYYQYFRDRYNGITETQQGWIDRVVSSGYLRTEWGLRYYLPNAKMERSGYVAHSTNICNYPVQGFATAEIIPIALVFFWHRLKRSDLQMFLVNTIHDSIIAELPAEEVDDFHELSRQALIDDVYFFLERIYGIRLTVPLGAGVKVARHWSGDDGDEEVTYEAGKELYS